MSFPTTSHSPLASKHQSSLTSLDPSETTVDFVSQTSLNSPLFLRLRLPAKTALVYKLRELPGPASKRAALKLSMCMAHPNIRRKSDGTYYLSPDRCKHRCCPVCGSIKASQTTQKILAKLSPTSDLRFLTLTIKSSNQPLNEQIDHVLRSFRRLRQTLTWKRTQSGGVATLQITYNQTTRRWHPHLHVLSEGNYVNHADLRSAWLRSTGDSSIVHIESVHDRSKQTKYVCRYVASNSDLTGWPDEALDEYVEALRSRRSLMVFGSLHQRRVESRGGDRTHKDSSPIIPLRLVARAIRTHHPLSRNLYDALKLHLPEVVAYLPRPIPDNERSSSSAHITPDDLQTIAERVYSDLTTTESPPNKPPKPPRPPSPQNSTLFAVHEIHGSD